MSNNFLINNSQVDITISPYYCAPASQKFLLPVPQNYDNSHQWSGTLQSQYQDSSERVNGTGYNPLLAPMTQLRSLNDLSQYCLDPDHNLPQMAYYPEVASFQANAGQSFGFHQNCPEAIKASDRNEEEYEREKQIEALNLDKDEKYVHLLKPYRYERIQEGDDVLQKVVYTYICKYDGCDKHFTKACNFLDHVRMHEGIKPYRCNKCSKEFVQKCNLKKHFKRHLSTTLEERKVYKCSKCHKGFTERYNLKTHMKIHLKDKNSV